MAKSLKGELHLESKIWTSHGILTTLIDSCFRTCQAHAVLITIAAAKTSLPLRLPRVLTCAQPSLAFPQSTEF